MASLISEQWLTATVSYNTHFVSIFFFWSDYVENLTLKCFTVLYSNFAKLIFVAEGTDCFLRRQICQTLSDSGNKPHQPAWISCNTMFCISGQNPNLPCSDSVLDDHIGRDLNVGEEVGIEISKFLQCFNFSSFQLSTEKGFLCLGKSHADLWWYHGIWPCCLSPRSQGGAFICHIR